MSPNLIFVIVNDDLPTDHPSPSISFIPSGYLRFPFFPCCPIYHHQDISLPGSSGALQPIDFTALYAKSSDMVSSQTIVGILLGWSPRFCFSYSRRYPINCKVLLVNSCVSVSTTCFFPVKILSSDLGEISQFLPLPTPTKADPAQAVLKKLSFHAISTVTLSQSKAIFSSHR